MYQHTEIFKEAPIKKLEMLNFIESEKFYQNGYIYLPNFTTSDEVKFYIEQFLAYLDHSRMPKLAPFVERLQLAKVDYIPSRHCPDAAVVEHLSLHFDMGIPLRINEDHADLYLFTALHFPNDRKPSLTQTRLFDLQGLAKVVDQFNLTPAQMEQNLCTYTEKFGDGWENYNSGRLTSLGQVLEALVGGNGELSYMRKHRISEWFNKNKDGVDQNGDSFEESFFRSIGIDLKKLEKRVLLRPGDLIIIDNTRVAHGRAGVRCAEELEQYFYGVPKATQHEVEEFRKQFINQLIQPKYFSSK